MLDDAAAQVTREPRLPSRRESAETGRAPQLAATLTGPVPAPATRDSPEAEVSLIEDGGDSAESPEPASPAARWDARLDVGLDESAASAEPCAVGMRGGASGAAHTVAPMDVIDDPDAVAARVASSQPFSDAGQRSVLDRLLDEAEALRGADEVAHDVV